MISIVAAPGTGKSEVLAALQAFGRKVGVKVATTASTGVAAVRVDGQTLHSFLHLPVNNPTDKSDKAKAVALQATVEAFNDTILGKEATLNNLAKKMDVCLFCFTAGFTVQLHIAVVVFVYNWLVILLNCGQVCVIFWRFALCALHLVAYARC